MRKYPTGAESERPRKSRSERAIKWLTQEQVAALFAAAKESPVRDRLILWFLYRLAMRAREVCDLPADAVDLQRWEVTVTGAKGGLTRTYGIPRDLRSLVRTWEHERDRGSATYFAGRQGKLTPGRVWQIYRPIADAAGIEHGGGERDRKDPSWRGLGLHALRHSAAVHALDAGCDIDDLRDLLRHRNSASTDVYANLSTKRRNGYLQRLEKSDAVVKVR